MRLIILGFCLYSSWATGQTIVYPSSLKSSVGSTSATALSAISLKDQSGTSRDAAKYIYFTPQNSVYSGDFTFVTSAKSLKGLKIDFNYRGPTYKTQEWALSLYNNSTGKYDKVATNSGAKSWAWSSLGVSVANPAPYLSSSGGIYLRYSSSKSEGSAIDYLALTLTEGSATPTPTPTPMPAPVVVSPTVTPSPSPSPSPSASPIAAPAPARAFNGVRAYGAKAPWNIPVAGLPIHPENAKYTSAMWSEFTQSFPELNFRKYTYPVYNAQEATSQYVIKDKNGWGNLNGTTIPFNANWKANAGTDAQIIVVDPVSGKEWNMWEAVIDTNAKQITVGNGNLCPGDYLTNNWDNKATKCTGSRGVGINYLAMLVRPWEIEAGKIEHALSMPIINTSGDLYVAPATKLEHPGKTGTIPEGMRFALNVTYKEIDDYIASLSGLSAAKQKALRVILVALKDYGWFITDTSGGSHLQFEAPESAQADWERIGVLPGQVANGVEHPRYSLRNFLTKERIITIVPSDQYPK